MADLGKVEYRVTPINRYQITRFFESDSGATGGTEQRGEYDNHEVAYEVAYALCRAEHERLGWEVGDIRIQYPKHVFSGAQKAVGATYINSGGLAA